MFCTDKTTSSDATLLLFWSLLQSSAGYKIAVSICSDLVPLNSDYLAWSRGCRMMTADNGDEIVISSRVRGFILYPLGKTPYLKSPAGKNLTRTGTLNEGIT